MIHATALTVDLANFSAGLDRLARAMTFAPSSLQGFFEEQARLADVQTRMIREAAQCQQDRRAGEAALAAFAHHSRRLGKVRMS